jgi:hypothetical protein
MSKTTPRKDLLNDLESYAYGETPSALKLLCTGRRRSVAAGKS